VAPADEAPEAAEAPADEAPAAAEAPAAEEAAVEPPTDEAPSADPEHTPETDVAGDSESTSSDETS
jgi:hypothetical protein